MYIYIVRLATCYRLLVTHVYYKLLMYVLVVSSKLCLVHGLAKAYTMIHKRLSTTGNPFQPGPWNSPSGQT